MRKALEILKSGPGILFALAGVASVGADLIRPPASGSYAAGWLFVVGLLVAPAAVARVRGVTPIRKRFALPWCALAVVAWLVVMGTAAPSGPAPILLLLSLLGVVFCWSLLTARPGEKL